MIKANSIGRVAGILTLAALYYLVIVVSIYFISYVTIRKNIILPYWPFIAFQKLEYFGYPPIVGSRIIWQSKPDCVEADDYLIYKPKDGVCRFTNPEFDISMTFGPRGRAVPPQPATEKKAIAVLGDSHAMGWGVNDDQTFSSVIAEKLKVDVFNLAVSSYGTRREVRRLLKSGLLDQVDTIIIQYCDNDFGENWTEFTEADYVKSANEFKSTLQTYNQAMSSGGPAQNGFNPALARLKYAVREPFDAVLRTVGLKKGYDFMPFGDDFSPHHQALKKVFNQYANDLKDKKIFIFYSNAHGAKFKNFPSGKDDTVKNLFFFQPDLVRSDYYTLDDHLNPAGHKRVGEAVVELLKQH